MRNNLSQVLTCLVRELDIPITYNGIDEELEKYPDHLSLLAVSDDPKANVVHHLMALPSNQHEPSLKVALSDWYEQKQKNYESWAKRYPVTEEKGIHSALVKQKQWCNLAEIKATAAIFINGRRLPQNHNPEDLKYFI